MKTKTEFEKFDNLVRGVLAVPHSEIKAKLDAEKKAKRRRKRPTTKKDDKPNQALR